MDVKIEHAAARRLQACWRGLQDRRDMERRFGKRRKAFEAERLRIRRDKAAAYLQQMWRRRLDRRELEERFLARWSMIERQRVLDHKNLHAGKIQYCYRKYVQRVMLHRKFGARRLEIMAEESQQRRVLEAKMAAQQARDAQDAARAALKQMQLSGWKLGCDDIGRNY